MDNYIHNFNNFSDIFIYDFNISDGGLGDCIKFFMYLIQSAINNNARCYYLINNIPIEKYLLLKYNFMYITRTQLHNLNNKFKIYKPYDFYNDWDTPSKQKIAINKITIPFSDIFIFSNETINNANRLLNIKDYISIHVRLGDKFLETDPKFVVCKNDTRNYDQMTIDNYINNNKDKKIILFSDNKAYKLTMKNKFNNIFITDINIGHTSLINTNHLQTLNTISELYLLSNSKEIMCNQSGFAVVASKFYRTPLILV